MPPECDRRERSRPRSVSVVIPAYNAAATLAEQLEALAAQQYEDDWEVVIADNGSTDGTADLARRYRPRFKALSARRRRAAARALLPAQRRGDSRPRRAAAYCDADDVVAPGWLQAMADAARHYDLIGGWLDERP